MVVAGICQWHNRPTMFSEPLHLLLADDHDIVLVGIRNALNDMPDLHIVGEVRDGKELFLALEELQPNFLLIDISMPEFEPLSAIRLIRHRYPDLRILVVSAHDDDIYVQGLLSAGVNGYHLKDQPLSDLRLAVQRVASGERWISSSLLDNLMRTPRLAANVPRLSTRQVEILRLLVKGLDNRAIADSLDVSVKTIENHLTRLYRQLGVQSRLEAVSYTHDNPELLAHYSQNSESQVYEDIPLSPGAGVPSVILVVDDNKRYRQQLRRIISSVSQASMIMEAADTTEALRIAEQLQPNLVLIDVILGDEDGISCARRVKASLPGSRIILISAYPDREFHKRGLEAGASAFLDKKDLDASTLQQIVEDALG